MKWIVPLSLLVLGELCADILAENWSITRTPYLAISALGAYLLANTFWLFALGNGSGLARGAVLFSVASGVIAVALGVVIYKEQLSHMQVAGLLLGLVSVVLISWHA
jgi:drug/metabolite transporter (DMT)-like permease